MKHLIYSLWIGILSISVFGSCIEDGFSTSSADQPTFSVDTLDIGTIFTEQPSTTRKFVVYNNADKSLNISSISISGANASLFRLNVDGLSGREFSDVEIRANDSIFVFVEVTLPANERDVPIEVTASLDFVTNGVLSHVILAATGRDVVRLVAQVLDFNARMPAGKPYQIYDSLVVQPGYTLLIEPGAELYFHDGAMLIVRGRLRAIGEQGNEITLAGDRTGNVAADISFDLMSRQWTGVFFTATSHDNEMSYCHICNTVQGVTVNGTTADTPPTLKMVNSRLRNSGYNALEVYYGDISAYGCEFAEAADGAVYLEGGSHIFNHCTFANYYLFSALANPILRFAHLTEEDDIDKPVIEAEITNSIIYGNGTDLSHGNLDDTSVYLRSCLLKSPGTDDEHFINCLWNTDPMYRTIREEYLFDYRLRENSPAIGAGDPSLTLPEAATDRYGMPRGSVPDLGAYVFQP